MSSMIHFAKICLFLKNLLKVIYFSFLCNQAEANTFALRRSSSWTSAMFELPSSSLSAVASTTKSAPKKTANKYLELLGDNEDADGYQLPLRSSKRSAQTIPCNHQTTSNIVKKPAVIPSWSSDQAANPLSPNSLNGEFHDISPVANKTEISAKSPTVNEQNLLKTNYDMSSESERFASWLEDSDNWSLSTASTATCHLDSNRRHSGVSTLSCISDISGIDLNYASKSSFC